VLAAGAAEADHEIFEAAGLVGGDGGIDEAEDAGEILVNALLLIQIVDDRGVLTRQSLEALFPAGIGEAAAVEDEAAAVTGFVLREALVERKAENADDEVVSVAGETLQFFRSEHALERAH
jgi:hypothetical protein